MEIVLIGVGLAMDAVAISLSNGMKYRNMYLKHMVGIPLIFGVFQGLMPLIGYFSGSFFTNKFESIDHWIAFILLSIIGMKMLKEAFEIEKVEICEQCQLTFREVIIQAVATSIDALIVGVSLVILGTNIIYASSIIGLITFVLCLIAIRLGKCCQEFLGRKAEFLGGIILIGIGVKVLVEHIFL
ncbi:MAG: manganese efflux pump MntP family protein [Filifactoraceae bacterium]